MGAGRPVWRVHQNTVGMASARPLRLTAGRVNGPICALGQLDTAGQPARNSVGAGLRRHRRLEGSPHSCVARGLLRCASGCAVTSAELERMFCFLLTSGRPCSTIVLLGALDCDGSSAPIAVGGASVHGVKWAKCAAPRFGYGAGWVRRADCRRGRASGREGEAEGKRRKGVLGR